jgi:tetratricopeptide (TPR) repeat protein
MLRRAVAAEPNNPWIRNAVVALLRELRHFEEAAQAARENVAQHPNSAVALVELANCLRLSAPAEVVLQTLRDAVARDPSDPSVHCALALEYLRQWRLAEADAIYDAVVAQTPRFVDAWIGKGLVARWRGESDVALARFETAVRYGPSIWAEAELAQEHVARLEYSAARAVLQAALGAHADDRRLLMQLGYLERAVGDRSAASVAFARARARHPRFVLACVEAHREALALGRTMEALELLETSLRLEPDEASALEAFAQVLQSADREADALTVLERVAKADPSAISARLDAARIEARLGRLDRAMTIVEGLLAYWGARPEFFTTKASLLRDAGLYEDAARALDEGVARLSDLPSLLYERAALAIQWGDLALAARLNDRLRAADGGRRQTWLLAHLAAAQWEFARAVEHVRETFAAVPADPQRLAFATKAALAVFDVDAAEASLRAEAAANRSSLQLRGQPAHALESHHGHLLAEWRLEQEALSSARLALAEADNSTETLLALVRQFPDYTPTAIALFVELRRCKRLTRLAEARRSFGARRIPRRIAQFWDQDRLPPDLARLAETWRDNNPACDYKLYSDRSAFEWLKSRELSEAARAFLRAREPAQRADLFRLAWLAHEGGYWADIDDRCVAPIDLIDPGGRDLVAYQEDIGSTANSFLGATPRHPLIVAALAAAVEAVNGGAGDILWLSTGPGLLTRVLAAAAAADLEAFLGPDGPLILERGELFAAVRIQCSAAYKHTPKHWSRTAFGRKAKTFGAKLDELLALAGVRPRVQQEISPAA